MCVAVLINSEKRIPRENLKAMSEANPHGGGVAWIDGNQVQYRKGMTWQQIDAIQDMIPRPFLLHFRIATRGGKIPELTHPFPIGMQAFTDDLIGLAPGVIIHNGTWGGYRPYVPAGIDPDKVSDTQVAAYVAETDESILDKVDWSNAIMRAVNGKADIVLRGRWTDYNGNLYSNMHWMSELGYSTYKNVHSFYNRPGNATGSYVPRKKGEQKSHQKNMGPMNQLNGKTVGDSARARRDTAPMGVGQVYNDNHVEGLYDDSKWTDEDREDAYKQWLRTRSNQTGYELAKARYEQSIQANKGGTGTQYLGKDNTSASEPWPTGPLFQSEELRSSPTGRMGAIPSKQPSHSAYDGTYENEILCPDCHEEIETIPCQCTYAERSVTPGKEIALEDLTDEELATLGVELTRGDSDGIPNIVTDDVEDMNAEGFSMDEADEEEDMSEIVLAGDNPQDWRKIDDYIRAQGIKI